MDQHFCGFEPILFDPRDTLTFMCKPPGALAQRMVDIGAICAGAHHLQGHWMGPERLHLSLALCHQGREGMEQAIARALSAGDHLRHAPVGITFDRIQSYNHGGGVYPFVLHGQDASDDVVGLRAALRGHMLRAGLVVDHGFHPHVTLLWADRIVSAHPIAPLRWRADELLLILSHVGRSRHSVVARWPLN